jgi:hypothetical protein
MVEKAPIFSTGGQGHIRVADVTAHTATIPGADLPEIPTFLTDTQNLRERRDA